MLPVLTVDINIFPNLPKMDELIAIIIIVVLCCVMFFAWLVSMATCPDAMVTFLSGHRSESNYASTHESKELIRDNEMDLDLENRPSYPSRREIAKSVSSAYLQLNSARRPSDKKLSVVPEQDEQLTVQSTVQNVRPTILRAPCCETKPKEAGEIV